MARLYGILFVVAAVAGAIASVGAGFFDGA